MLTALRSLPAPLDQWLPVLFFDPNSLIPNILNSIKLIFLSNGCQGTRISCLFLEKKSLVYEKIILEQVRSEYLRTYLSRHFENRSFSANFAVSSQHFTKSK